MNASASSIECPNCGHEIDISDVLYHQIEEDLKEKLQDELNKERDKYRSDVKKLNAERIKFEQQQEQQKEAVDKAVRDQLRGEREKLSESITARVEEEQSERLKSLEKELDSKSKQVKQLNKAQTDIERLKREVDEAESKAKLKAERTLNSRLAEATDKIQQRLADQSSLKVKEKNLLIQQLTDQVKEMQRKAEQGSMQVQGEAQELVIEEWLAQTYPFDTIEEIKKGQLGADCLQTVNTREMSNCGTIYYESKRTRAFQPAWLEKFKKDIRDKGADIGVLVTETMPADLPRMGLKEGVWVCSFAEFKGLSNVLRESIISIHDVVAGQENRGDKMSLVYDFLTSNEFRMQVEAIVEGFTQMQIDLDKEKRAMISIWKKREKQIDKVLLNTSDMYSSIKGIAGNAIPDVAQLELTAPDDDDNEEDE